MSWDRTQTEALARANNWNRYDMTFYVDSVSYDGLTTSNNSSISYPTTVSPSGAYVGGPVFTKTVDIDMNSTLNNFGIKSPSYF